MNITFGGWRQSQHLTNVSKVQTQVIADCFRMTAIGVSPVGGRSVKGPLTEPTAAAQIRGREPLFLSLKRHYIGTGGFNLCGQSSFADARSARKSTSSTKNSTRTERDQLSWKHCHLG